eukprot:gene23224-35590_t
MLKQLVEFDHQVSLQLYTGMQGIPRSLLHYFCLTGEGYFWLAITPLLAVWCRARGYAWQESLWSNLWLANIIDIIFIAISKYVFRRARPLYEGTNKTASPLPATFAMTFHECVVGRGAAAASRTRPRADGILAA